METNPESNMFYCVFLGLKPVCLRDDTSQTPASFFGEGEFLFSLSSLDYFSSPRFFAQKFLVQGWDI